MPSVRRAGFALLAAILAASFAPIASGETGDPPVAKGAAPRKHKHARTKGKKVHPTPTSVTSRTGARLTLAAKADIGTSPASLVDDSLLPFPTSGSCAADMVSIEKRYCIDRWELQYGYSNEREHGRCNDAGRSPMLAVWGLHGDSSPEDWSPLKMNDERLNQLPGSLARTGAHAECTNEYGVFDMVGNLHEWTSDPAGTFQGGYYLDTKLNGAGCAYTTTAHDVAYHDYSTGFRCCADPR
jgi:hypothetical protein